jgi:hypothetical protein
MRKIAMLCAAAAFAAGAVSGVAAQSTREAPPADTARGGAATSGSVTTDSASGRSRADVDDSASVRGAGADTSRTTRPKPGASANAPGRITGSTAQSNAPGQVKKEKGDTSAEEYAPGHEAQPSGSSDINGGASSR